jgi:quercetin dioxygenase-like cupin family protein
VADLLAEHFDNLPSIRTRVGGKIHHGVEPAMCKDASKISGRPIRLQALDASTEGVWPSPTVQQADPVPSGQEPPHEEVADKPSAADNQYVHYNLLPSDDRLKVVLFGFAQGEELSERTASMPAVLHFIQGEAKLTLGDDTLDARPGTWVHMPKGLRHSIQAKTPVVMLLLLLK